MERKSILKEREAYEAVVAFIHRCTELGITEEQTNEIHREVEGLIKAGIEIGRKENTTVEDSDVKCFGTSKNPMTKDEWEEYRKTIKAGPRPD